MRGDGRGAGPAATPLVVVRAADVAPQPWRNGGGATRELLRRPAAGDAWSLRLSLADIDADGPFSPFPGIDRHFAVIEGAGVRLRLRYRVHVLAAGDEPLAFDGADAPDCLLADGPTRDLNLMVDRRHGRGAMRLARVGSALTAPASASRGVFAVDALHLRRDGGPPVALPAGTLAWCDGGDGTAWTLDAAPGTSASPLAFHLVFEPLPHPDGTTA